MSVLLLVLVDGSIIVRVLFAVNFSFQAFSDEAARNVPCVAYVFYGKMEEIKMPDA